LFIFCFIIFLFQTESGQKKNDKLDVDPGAILSTSKAEGCGRDAIGKTAGEERFDRGSLQNTLSENREELNDSDWEDGSIPNLDSTDNLPVTIEFSETANSDRRKPVRRSSAEDKVNYTFKIVLDMGLSHENFLPLRIIKFSVPPYWCRNWLSLCTRFICFVCLHEAD
jgi:hypothetical protein